MKTKSYIETLAKEINKLGIAGSDSLQINISDANPTIIIARTGYGGFITEIYMENNEGTFDLIKREPENLTEN